MAEDQIENQYQQKQPADTEPAAMAVPAITEAAAEQQEEYEDDEDQVHDRTLQLLQVPRGG